MERMKKSKNLFSTVQEEKSKFRINCFREETATLKKHEDRRKISILLNFKN